MKRQPHSTTTLKRWRGDKFPSVYGGEDVKTLAFSRNIRGRRKSTIPTKDNQNFG
jgi:hypothetical protein